MTTFDRDAAVAAYLVALKDAQRLAESLTADEWTLPTDLQGWTVQDNVAHIVALECELAGHPRPDHEPDWSALPHVDPANRLQKYMEVPVDVRRGTPPAELLRELADIIAERQQQIDAYPSAADAQVTGPVGWTAPLWRVLTVRVFDIWAHEQDIRRAVGRRGNLDGAGAEVGEFRLRYGLEYVIGKLVAPPPGTAVRWVVDGPRSFTSTVVVGEGGRATESASYEGEPAVTLRTDWENFVLLGCGRASFDRSRVSVDGDPALGNRVLEHAAITP
ncbi:MAG: maleylpyruvate isomerase family mycothiol-dependent enzyme [Candidatus Nanopelagicales bacterium]